jgi:hypothetical protein
MAESTTVWYDMKRSWWRALGLQLLAHSPLLDMKETTASKNANDKKQHVA